VTISLAESIGNGNFTPYAVRSTVDLEPLYDISTSDLVLTLVNDCDDFGDSEPHVFFRYPDGKRGDAEGSMSGGETGRIRKFAQTYTEVGQSANLGQPTFRFIEEESLDTGFYSTRPEAPHPPLLPGKTRTVAFDMTARNDNFRTAKLSYKITYTLRQYPNL